VAAVIVSAVGYFFSIIAVFTAITALVTLLIGGFNAFKFEKVSHYPHPRPAIEQTITPTIPEPHHAGAGSGTNEATPAKDPLAQDRSTTKDSRAASLAKPDADSHRPGRKISSERFAHPRQPARQLQDYEGNGNAMALGSAEGRSALEDLNGQR